MITYQKMCDEITVRCSNFTPAPFNTASQIFLTEYQKETVISVVSQFTKNGHPEVAKNLLKEIFSEQVKGKSGKLFEAMTYGWLIEQGIPFLPQPSVEAHDCFKKQCTSYCADGQIGCKQPAAIFDVKQYGIGTTHFGTMEEFLMEQFPDYIIQISGDLNWSTDAIERELLSQKADIVSKLNKKISATGTNKEVVTLDVPNLFGVIINAVPRVNKISWSVSTHDYTEWARNNRFYFMSHSSQFCTNVPYMIFCPFDNSLDTDLSHQSAGNVAWQLRFLCRRIFVELARMDTRSISEFDGKARNDVTVSVASKKISAIIFLDVTKKNTYNDCRVWAYFNPNADHPLYEFQINEWFRIPGARIDTFEFDNY